MPEEMSAPNPEQPEETPGAAATTPPSPCPPPPPSPASPAHAPPSFPCHPHPPRVLRPAAGGARCSSAAGRPAAAAQPTLEGDWWHTQQQRQQGAQRGRKGAAGQQHRGCHGQRAGRQGSCCCECGGVCVRVREAAGERELFFWGADCWCSFKVGVLTGGINPWHVQCARAGVVQTQGLLFRGLLFHPCAPGGVLAGRCAQDVQVCWWRWELF